jgi:hypothetical protein
MEDMIELLTKEDAEQAFNIVFDDFKEYLSVLESGKMLILEAQALKYGFPIKEDEKPFACRKVDNKYLPLYDRSDEMKFISKEEFKTGNYGFVNHLKALNLDAKQEEIIGYYLHYGSFYPVYDLKGILNRLGLKKVNKVKYPIVEKNLLTFDLSGHDDKIEGCDITFDDAKVYYNIEKIAASENKPILEELNTDYYTELPFPLVNSLFFNNGFKNAVDCSDVDFEGYYQRGNHIMKVYDIRKVCEKLSLVKNFSYENNARNEVSIHFSEYKNFKESLPKHYEHLYTYFVGTTGNDEIIIRGSDSAKWAGIMKKYNNFVKLPSYLKSSKSFVSINEPKEITFKQKKYIQSLLQQNNKILIKPIDDLTFSEAGYIIGHLNERKALPAELKHYLTDYIMAEIEDEDCYALDDYGFDERD